MRTSGRSTGAIVAVLLALASLLAGLCLMMIKTDWTSQSYSWQPRAAEPATTQLVMSASPQTLEFRSTCDALRLAGLGRTTDWTVFATLPASTLPSTAIELTMFGDVLRLRTHGEATSTEGIRVGEGCNALLRYDGQSRMVTVQAGQDSMTAPFAPERFGQTQPPLEPTVAGFTVDPKLLDNASLSIQTKPSVNQIQSWRTLLTLLVIVALVAVVWIIRQSNRTSEPPRDESPQHESPQDEPPAGYPPVWTASDTAVSIACLIALFFMPALFDDGWVLTTVRSFTELGFFSNYYSAEAAAQPQGFWWDSLQRIWLTGLETPLLLIRAPSLLILLTTWWFVRRRIVDQLADQRFLHPLRTVLACAAIAFVFAWTPTLRFEPLIGLLTAVTIALVIEYTRKRQSWMIVAAAGVGALALTTHQTGWTTACAALAMIPAMVAEFRRPTHRTALLQVIGLAVLVFSAAFTTLTFSQIDLWAWNTARVSFVAGQLHDQFLNEGARIASFTEGAVSTAAFFTLGLVALAAIAALVRKQKIQLTPSNAAAWAAFGGLGGVLLTSSKWIWHYSALLPLVLTLGLVGLNAIWVNRGWRKSRVLGACFGIGLVGLIVTRQVAHPVGDYDDLVNWNNWVQQWPTWLRPTSLAFWVLSALVVCAALWMYRSRQGGLSRSAPVVWTSIAVTAVVSTVTLGPYMLSAIRQPTTSWAGLTATSLQADSCGIAGGATALPMADRTTQLPVFGATDLGALGGYSLLSPAFIGLGGGAPAHSPIGGNVVFQPQFGSRGPTSTPWFEATSLPMQTWLQVSQGAIHANVQWNAAGELSTQPIDRYVAAGQWILVILEPPENATSFRIRFNSSDGAGVLAVANPVAVHSTKTLVEAAGDQAVWAEPDKYLLAPCLRPPSIARGYFEDFTYSVGMPTVNGFPAWQGASNLVEVACMDQITDVRRCIYQVNQIQTPIRTDQ